MLFFIQFFLLGLGWSIVGPLIPILADDFKVNIPKDWKETLLMQGIYNYVPEQAENDEVINIVVLEIDDTYVKDLKELLDVSIKATQEQVEDFILIKSNVDDTLDNNKAATLKFVQIIEGETTEINQIFAIANNKLYTITYSCPRQCDNFDVYTEMISSFKIN